MKRNLPILSCREGAGAGGCVHRFGEAARDTPEWGYARRSSSPEMERGRCPDHAALQRRVLGISPNWRVQTTETDIVCQVGCQAGKGRLLLNVNGIEDILNRSAFLLPQLSSVTLCCTKDQSFSACATASFSPMFFTTEKFRKENRLLMRNDLRAMTNGSESNMFIHSLPKNQE